MKKLLFSLQQQFLNANNTFTADALEENRSTHSRDEINRDNFNSQNKGNTEMMFLKRLFHLQTELNRVVEEKRKNAEYKNSERSNDITLYSPQNKMTPKLNLALNSFHPKFKHDNIDTVRKGARSRRKPHKAIRIDTQQSQMPSNRLEPLIKHNLTKKSVDQKYDSSEDRKNTFENIALTGNKISNPNASTIVPTVQLESLKLQRPIGNSNKTAESRSQNNRSFNSSFVSRSFRDDVSPPPANNSLMVEKINKNKYMTSIDQDMIEQSRLEK